MKSNFKVFVVALALVLAAPAALAQTPTPRRTEPGAQQTFCTLLPALSANLTKRIGSVEGNVSGRKQERTQTWEERKAGRDQDIETAREAADQKRFEFYRKFEEAADTGAEDEAAGNYKAAIEAAVAKRRQAVNKAMETYRTELEKAFTARNAALRTAETNYKNAIQAAIAKATSDCAAGVSPAEVRQAFANSLKAAQTRFREARQAVDKAGQQVRTLAQTRNAAVRKAMEEFKAEAEQARIAYKKALGSPDAEESEDRE